MRGHGKMQGDDNSGHDHPLKRTSLHKRKQQSIAKSKPGGCWLLLPASNLGKRVPPAPRRSGWRLPPGRARAPGLSRLGSPQSPRGYHSGNGSHIPLASGAGCATAHAQLGGGLAPRLLLGRRSREASARWVRGFLTSTPRLLCTAPPGHRLPTPRQTQAGRELGPFHRGETLTWGDARAGEGAQGKSKTKPGLRLAEPPPSSDSGREKPKGDFLCREVVRAPQLWHCREPRDTAARAHTRGLSRAGLSKAGLRAPGRAVAARLMPPPVADGSASRGFF